MVDIKGTPNAATPPAPGLQRARTSGAGARAARLPQTPQPQRAETSAKSESTSIDPFRDANQRLTRDAKVGGGHSDPGRLGPDNKRSVLDGRSRQQSGSSETPSEPGRLGMSDKISVLSGTNAGPGMRTQSSEGRRSQEDSTPIVAMTTLARAERPVTPHGAASVGGVDGPRQAPERQADNKDLPLAEPVVTVRGVPVDEVDPNMRTAVGVPVDEAPEAAVLKVKTDSETPFEDELANERGNQDR